MTDTTLIENGEIIDLLDRQDFVDKMLLITETLSNNKKNACYAINGSWGVGKSFVLDMFEKQAKLIIQENSILSRYLVFRYDCWEYDYYEEPLISIVVSMLDEIDENVNLLSEETKNKIVEVLKIVGKGFIKKAIQVVDEYTGVPLEEVAGVISDGCEAADSKAEKEQKFDQYIAFKKNLKKLQTTISKLAEEQTVVFVVDELDRCLPEYSIKVLERLHHLFDTIPNVQVILSIDKGQLEHVVRQIYGECTDVDKYLAKFIDFELRLSEGSFTDQEKFERIFEKYLSRFEIVFESTTQVDVNEFLQIIFEGIDIRSRIAILDKCLLLHDLVNEEKTKIDAAYMCIELLLAVIKHTGVNVEEALNYFSIRNVFTMNTDKHLTEGLRLITAKYNNPDNVLNYFAAEKNEYYVRISDIWGILLAAYRCVIGTKNDRLLHGTHNAADIKKYTKSFWELMQTIC